MTEPECLLFAQHGWADNQQTISRLAQEVATPHTRIIAPDLGYIKTWIRIAPLINLVESQAEEALSRHPTLPIRIIGHSMGGLIWLEVLHRHREWWPRIERLALVAVPVGGADLGRIFDPLGLGIGIARDLGVNRRALAEAVAAEISTLVIAGDKDGGSDGTITLESVRFRHARLICIPGLAHHKLRSHPSVAGLLRDFWEHGAHKPLDDAMLDIVERLRALPGMTDAHRRDLRRARVHTFFRDGHTIRTWKNLVGVQHVFIADGEGQCLFAGFVGWLHARELRQTLAAIEHDYAADIFPAVPPLETA
jgi:pimeloyl-ACP methyl ester carboxylesterase